MDVGKTHAKVSVWQANGRMLRQTTRPNPQSLEEPASLDIEGIAGWLGDQLRSATGLGRIDAIVPVAHGAAAVLLDGDQVVCALDYQSEIPVEIAVAYDAERDPFELTLSPRLPGGLNLGAQLFWLDRLYPALRAGGRLLLWPQFWAWWLSGEPASEVTSLGCHSDLWRPMDATFSDLALR